MLPRFEKKQRSERPDDCADGVHRALETKRAAIRFARNGGGEERFSYRCADAAAQPRSAAREQNVPGIGRECERCRAKRGDRIARHGDRFAARQAIGVKTGSHFREARQTIGHAFDDAQPDGGDSERGEERGHRRRRDFVRPIAKERSEADAEDGGVEPARFFMTGCRRRCVSRRKRDR